LLFSTFKAEFFSSIIFFHLDGLLRLSFSVIILYLFEAVLGGDKRAAYIYVAALTVIWYLSQLFKQSALMIAYLLASQVKSALAMLLYAKISKMTAYVLRSS
jgi:hypothetical protein